MPLCSVTRLAATRAQDPGSDKQKRLVKWNHPPFWSLPCIACLFPSPFLILPASGSARASAGQASRDRHLCGHVQHPPWTPLFLLLLAKALSPLVSAHCPWLAILPPAASCLLSPSTTLLPHARELSTALSSLASPLAPTHSPHRGIGVTP